MYSVYRVVETYVDDRPLTASAWKAWLGDNSDRSALERKVENAFSRHVASTDVHRAEPFRVVSPAKQYDETHRKHKPQTTHSEKVLKLIR